MKSVLQCISKHSWFSSVDLKDAYYSIPVNKFDRKYLRFYWNGHLYEYTCLPNRLTTAPRILKVSFSHLRKKGHTNVAYIDDSLLISNSFSECSVNISETVSLLDSLGFTIHPTKSVMQTTQIIIFLGFVLNSQNMTIRLTNEKAKEIEELCCKYVKNREITIREFAQIVGKLVTAEPGVEYAPIYIKSLEIEKNRKLKESNGNFEYKMIISNESVKHLVGGLKM